MKLILGDCVEAMAGMEPESVDAVCTDPPYGIRMMGMVWDGKAIEEEAAKPWNAEGHMRLTGSPDSPNRKLIHRSGSAYRTRAGTAGAYDFSLKGNYAFQEWTEQWARQALRVLKPGGHLISFSSTRTYHRMVSGIEDAGFEIRDTMMWIQGQGFPKSYNMAGGLGTNLKPSFEPIVLARKPLKGKVYENVTRYGTGALNIDATRIAATDSFDQVGITHGKETSEQGYQVVQRSKASPSAKRRQSKAPGESVGASGWVTPARPASYSEPHAGEELGRWPANVLVSHTEECRLVGTETVDGRTIRRPVEKMLPFGGGAGKEYDTIEFPDEQVELWECVDGCPVKELDRQSGTAKSSGTSGLGAYGTGVTYGDGTGTPQGERVGFGDVGGASRFFYQPKVSGAERHAGLNHPGFQFTHGAHLRDVINDLKETGNYHPTVKPIDLMRWLCRLVTPQGGVVLDPFTGSGSTGCAAILEGLDFIGCEQDEKYMAIAEARIAWWTEHGEDGLRIVAERDAKLRAGIQERERLAEMGQETLF